MAGIAFWLRRANPLGFEQSDGDYPTGMNCPRSDCQQEVYYNGNYFCLCGWAAEPTPTSEESEQFNEALYLSLMEKRRA